LHNERNSGNATKTKKGRTIKNDELMGLRALHTDAYTHGDDAHHAKAATASS
jgi:hypothetical protein